MKFKETELPAKEADKNRSKGIYQSLEGAVQAGQLKVPPGYHPLDVEKEWGKLHVAILEREKQLRSEFERWAAAGVGEAVGGGWGPTVAGKPPEGESLPGEEIPLQARKPTLGRVQLWAAGRQGGQEQEGAPWLGAWREIPSQRVPWVLRCRLECLQRIVSKLQMEAGLCEEQLNQADALLQSDIRLLAAGKAAQRAGEVERDLDKADNMIRMLFNDVQALKDGRHPQGEQMYRRWAVPCSAWCWGLGGAAWLRSPPPDSPLSPGYTACTNA